jgi:hypothetical protein
MVPTSTPISLRFNDGFLIHLCNGCAKSVHLPKHRLPVSGSEEAVEAIHNFGIQFHLESYGFLPLLPLFREKEGNGGEPA